MSWSQCFGSNGPDNTYDGLPAQGCGSGNCNRVFRITDPNTGSNHQYTSNNDDYAPPSNTPASSTDIASNILPFVSLSTILNESHSGQPDINIQPIADTLNTLQNDINAEVDSDPSTVPSGATSPQSFSDIQLQTFESTNSNLSESPVDAEKCPDGDNTVLCLSVGSDLVSQELINHDINTSITSVLLSSSSSCPAPQSLNLMGTSVALKWDPICDFASGINAIILAVCTIAGLYILAGSVRS